MTIGSIRYSKAKKWGNFFQLAHSDKIQSFILLEILLSIIFFDQYIS